MMVIVIRTPKEHAETVRSEMVSRGTLDRDHRIRSDGDDVLIPITGRVDGYTIESADLEPAERRETDYRNLVDVGDVPRGGLPSSFDVVGDIAIVKIPDELIPYRKGIGDAILRVTPNLRAVMMDSGVKGELRIRELERIAGDGGTETVHKEFGIRMAVDPSKVYFNPRLATERRRIASLVRDGETVIDMFAGIGPFPLVISRHSNPGRIYAIDLNPDAKEFMERNAELNRTDVIIPIQGDSRTVLKGLPKADRIIMNLPQSSMDFLMNALASLKEGGTIHMYRIMERDANPGDIVTTAKGFGYDVTVRNTIELKTYSPSMSVYVFDIVLIS